MDGYTQANLPVRVTSPLGPDALLFVECEGTEGVSELSRFRLRLAAPLGSSVPFEKLLAADLALSWTLPRDTPGTADPRFVHGVVSHFRHTHSDQTFDHYEADLVPHFWLSTLRVQSRIFHRLSVPDVLRAVLDPLKPHVRFQLAREYPAREYTVQYRESDFAFASRLMEEEGIWYAFDHAADADTLVVADSALAVRPVPGGERVPFDDGRGGVRRSVRVTRWETGQSVRADVARVRDYHFGLPAQTLEGERPLPAQVTAGQVQYPLAPNAAAGLEHYEPVGGYAKRYEAVGPEGTFDGTALQPLFDAGPREAALLAEAAAARCVTVAGESSCWHFLPGRRFTVDGHGAGDGAYFLTRVEHKLSGGLNLRSGAFTEPVVYANRFAAVPAGVTYRPERVTPRPVVPGPQTAVVVGPAGQEIFVDRYGRVRVQFHWDRGGDGRGTNSRWVRVAQVWAGPNWGAFFWPRIGHEVVVAFEDGDPDRPLVVGSVYNDANRPPVNLPAEMMLGGIKSCSFGGDPLVHFNALVFHDTPGVEFLQIHSETNDTQNSEAFRFEFAPQAAVSIHGRWAGGFG